MMMSAEATTSNITIRERYHGALLGMAAGDALGTTLEFKRPGSFEPITDMVGGGPFNLNAGEWTDDTSMALCLAESLVTQQDFDAKDQMERYVRWWQEGYLSATDSCFDIGGTVVRALSAFRRSGEPYCGDSAPHTAGNGSLMRLTPIPMAYRNDNALWNFAVKSSATTHGARTCLDACGTYSVLIARALHGCAKADILDVDQLPGELCQQHSSPEIVAIIKGSYQHKSPPDIRGTGYVVDALEAALWAFYHSESFEQGALLAVNLGDDADTTGAIYGQLAGAFYGVEGIPLAWRNKLVATDLIGNFADELLAFSNAGAG
jgi:ADP-ribosyl-[dinitrogen reductase] hydrolase